MIEPSKSECRDGDFCAELSGRSDTTFHKLYGGLSRDRVICRSAHLRVIADMSPLCLGHLLIVPDQHYMSFADLVRKHRVEVEDVKNQIFGQYTHTFGNPVILEHGSAYGMNGSSCITHAHWHLLPLEFDVVHGVIAKDGLAWSDLGDLGDLAASGAERTYFYCADRQRGRLYGVGRTMRRQYLRSVAGAILGIPDPEWDYAVVTRKELLRETLARTGHWHIDP